MRDIRIREELFNTYYCFDYIFVLGSLTCTMYTVYVHIVQCTSLPVILTRSTSLHLQTAMSNVRSTLFPNESAHRHTCIMMLHDIQY